MSEETESTGLGDGLSPEATTPTPTPTESSGLDFSSPEAYKQFVDTLPEDIRGYKAFQKMMSTLLQILMNYKCLKSLVIINQKYQKRAYRR